MTEVFKQSKGKRQLSTIPVVALVETAKAFEFGLTKYSYKLSWRDGDLSHVELLDAVRRHILKYLSGEECAADSKVSHLAHASAGLAMLMDLKALGLGRDDRPAACPLDMYGSNPWDEGEHE